MATSRGRTDARRSAYTPIGAVTLDERPSGAHTWRFAAPDGASVVVALLADDLLRVRLVPPGVEPAPSWAVVTAEWPAPDVRVERDPLSLTLSTPVMRVEIALDPFRLRCRWPDGAPFAEDDPELGMGAVGALGPADVPNAYLPAGSVRCTKRLAPGERILGCGERTTGLDQRRRHIVFYNVDPPQVHGPDTGSMYVSIPFWMGQRDGRTYGIFLDSVRRADLDAGLAEPDRMSFGAAGGELTYYVFAGPTPAVVLARYADLTGHAPLPPRWALGYAQSRWSYFPHGHLRSVASGFRERGIPCDTLYLDIDYMDGYRDFTWSPLRFPDPPGMLRELGEQGFKVVTIIDPGIKADPTDPTYIEGLERDYFVRRADGSLFIGVVWPGECVFPDFSRAEVREWWGNRHKGLLEAGVAGIWDDMNEPSLTDRLVPGAGVPHGTTMPDDAVHRPQGPDGPALPHAAFHNAYGLQMARATAEGLARLRPGMRPFVLTRSGYAGIQRYAAVWTGDNASVWPHLRLAMRMCLGLGLSGVPFVGFDTGGFWENTTGEMLVRFTQLGALFPFFRNHSALYTASQEPWQLGQPFEELCRNAITLRYRLLPYLYTAFARSVRAGAPVARALAYSFPEEPSLATVDDEVMLGEDLLAAPVLEADTIQRDVLLPPGGWVDWWTGERFMGPARVRVNAPMDILPLFAREGAIIPMGPVMEYTGQRPEEPLTLVCYLGDGDGARAAGTLYEDDGATTDYERGAWRQTRYTGERSGNRVTITASQPEGAYESGPRETIVELRLPHPPMTPHRVRSVTLDGQPLASYTVTPRRYDTAISAHAGQLNAPFSVTVDLEP